MGSRKWNEKELKYLKENYIGTNKEEIIRVLDRSWSTIQKQARKIGIFKGKKIQVNPNYNPKVKCKEGFQFCKKCNRELPKNYKYFPKLSNEKNFRKVCRECNEKYGKFLKDDFKIKKIWTRYEEELFIKIYPHYTNEEIIEKYFNDLTLKQISEKAYKLKLIGKTQETKMRSYSKRAEKLTIIMKGREVSEETRKKLSETRKKLHKEGKIISPWKGRVVSQEEKRRISERVKGRWAGKNNPRHKNPLLGANNGRWKGGITPLSTALRENIYDWKQESMKRCNYRCVITGGEFDNIHHLYPFNKIIMEALNNLNLDIKCNLEEYNERSKDLIAEVQGLHKKYGLGICLCKEIHKLFHDNYSYYDFTEDDFKEFKDRYIKGEFNDKKII